MKRKDDVLFSPLSQEPMFFRYWLDGRSLADQWHHCVKGLFLAESQGPVVLAQSRHHRFAEPVRESRPGVRFDIHQVPDGFSVNQPAQADGPILFVWKTDQVWAYIEGVWAEAGQGGQTLVELFLWKVVRDLRQMDLEVETIRDDLTSVFNQHHLRRLIDMEVERSRRYGLFFSLLFLDLDNLKAVNEKHGHLIGTEVLKEVASMVSASVRKGDVVARFGGDEFVILLLHAHPEDAFRVGSRIVHALSEHLFLQDRGLNIRISGSVGISGYPEHGSTTERLIQNADLAMYEVKMAGKNGVEIYRGE